MIEDQKTKDPNLVTCVYYEKLANTIYVYVYV